MAWYYGSIWREGDGVVRCFSERTCLKIFIIFSSVCKINLHLHCNLTLVILSSLIYYAIQPSIRPIFTRFME